MNYENFIEHIREQEELSENTIKTYSESLKQFFAMFDELTKPNLIQFKKKLSESKKIKTVAIRITAMNKYADFIGKSDCKVKNVREQSRFFIENVPEDDEYNRLLEYCKRNNEKYYWIVRFLGGTGVRISELARLKKSHLQKGYAEMHSKGKERRILIPKNLIQESAYFFKDKKDDDYLFLSLQGNLLSERTINSTLHSLGKKAKVRKEILHPHAFRHYFAIKMLKATNNDISLVSSLLGHSKISTTAIYTMRTLKEQEKALSQMMNW